MVTLANREEVSGQAVGEFIAVIRSNGHCLNPKRDFQNPEECFTTESVYDLG